MVYFPPASPPRPYTPPLLTHKRHMPSPSHSSFITRTILGEEYKSFSSSLCNLHHSPFISSFLGPNILLNTMFSNTLSLLSFRNTSDQVSHPYKTTGKIIVLYILIFKFWDSLFKHCNFPLIDYKSQRKKVVKGLNLSKLYVYLCARIYLKGKKGRR